MRGASIVEMRVSVVRSENDRLTTLVGPPSRIDANSALPDSGRSTPHPAIGGRASAVVVMVESKEIVILTAVAGHRLPHCWRDDSTGWDLRSKALFPDVETMSVVGCARVGRRWSRSGGRFVTDSRYFVAVAVLSTSV